MIDSVTGFAGMTACPSYLAIKSRCVQMTCMRYAKAEQSRAQKVM